MGFVKHSWDGMPFIEDKTMFRAICFARKMTKEGMGAGLAISKAARYYELPESDVAHWMGKCAAARKKHRGRIR